LRLLVQDPRLDILVAYCSLQGAERGLDPEFGVQVQWYEPLLEGFSWIHVPNKSLRPGLARCRVSLLLSRRTRSPLRQHLLQG